MSFVLFFPLSTIICDDGLFAALPRAPHIPGRGSKDIKSKTFEISDRHPAAIRRYQGYSERDIRCIENT